MRAGKLFLIVMLTSSMAMACEKSSPCPERCADEPDSSPSTAIAADGFPSGQGSPEGAVADFVRAYSAGDEATLDRVLVKLGDEDYKEVRKKFVAQARERPDDTEADRDDRITIQQLFRARYPSRNGPGSFAYSIGFDDLKFVDVEIQSGDREPVHRRNLAFLRCGRWYVHPFPQMSWMLSYGLNEESESTERIEPVPAKAD